MVKTIIYCDRCRKECEKTRNKHGYRIFQDDECLDLCQKCYDELYDWLNCGAKMENEENNGNGRN